MEKVNLSEIFSLIDDYFHPRVAVEPNGQQVKLVKLKGEFIWHSRRSEDELFLAMRGRMKMVLRDRDAEINEREFLIVPRGTDHRPRADEEVHILLFEPASTINTGNKVDRLTRTALDKI